MSTTIQVILLTATTTYNAIVSFLEDTQPLPGQLINVGKHRLHYCLKGKSNSANPTIILDHSLGGIEGYFLIEELSKITEVCIYDRAGYGWSEHSPHPRTSQQIVTELDTLLTKAEIKPPYILVGDSFGSYNVRLYADIFPEKVVGIVLTDGLHESQMLKMPIPIKLLKLFFISGFLMSIVGSMLGIVRLLKIMRVFELLKPQLRKFSLNSLHWVKRSFCRPKHWITMTREMINLEKSARQVSVAENLGKIPLVSIKAKSFFKTSFGTIFLPLKSTDKLRDKIHLKLSNLSTDCIQIEANKSSHFVWIDQPNLIIDGVKILINKIH